jgi:hypothetical protein
VFLLGIAGIGRFNVPSPEAPMFLTGPKRLRGEGPRWMCFLSGSVEWDRWIGTDLGYGTHQTRYHARSCR